MATTLPQLTATDIERQQPINYVNSAY